MAAVLVSTLVFAQETDTTFHEKDAPAAGESALSFSQNSQNSAEEIVYSNDADSDEDGVSDYDEIYTYGTNPLRESTDGDAYDDGQELFGYSPANYGELGGQMPSYVKWPGNSPFVASYPQIDFKVDPQFKVFIHKELHFANRTQVNVEHTFGTIVTRGITSSVGVGGSHTGGGYTDVSNKATDAEVSQNWRNNFNSKQIVSSQTAINGETKTANIGVKIKAGADAHALLPIPFVYGKAYLLAEPEFGYKTVAENKITTNKQSGTSKEVLEGGAVANSRVVESGSSTGAFSSSTLATTVTNSISTTVSSVDLYTIGTAEEWEEGWSQDTTNAAKLRFMFNIVNSGTDRTVGISDLRFTIKIGPYTKTYPDLTQQGVSLPALNPGELRNYNAEVILTLDELKEFDTNGKVQIYVEDYNLGNSNEEAYAQDAYDGGVLFVIYDGSKDYGSNIEFYLVHAGPTDTYLDLINRLNKTVPVGSPSNPKKTLDFVVVNNSLKAIKGIEVADNAAWFVQTEGISEKPFLFKEINGGGRKAILTYSKDSDGDFYPDRIERKIGTNQDDTSSFPAPKVAAAYFIDGITLADGIPAVSYKVKLGNLGNYDAYGLEARMFSPDFETNITNELAGGAVRIKPGQTIVLNETLKWTTGGKMEQGNTNLASLGRGATATARVIGSADNPPVTITGQPANEIIDGNVGSFSFFNGEGAWQINLSNYEIVDRVRLNLGSGAVVRVWASYDGTNWKFVGGEPTGYWGTGWNDIQFAPMAIKYVKITLHPNGDTPILREVEVLGYQYNGKSLLDLTQPRIEILYNTPRGDERFVTAETIPNANASIEKLSEKMLRSLHLDANVPESITYGDSGEIKMSFTNPSMIDISKGRMAVSFLGPDGSAVKEFVLNTDFPQGFSSTKVTLNTGELNKSLIGKTLAVFIAAADHNNVMIAETLERVKIENPVKITNYAPGDVPAVISLNRKGSQMFSIFTSANSPLNYKWFLDGVQVTGANLQAYNYKARTLGNRTLKVEVTDGTYENSHSWAIEVTGTPNRAPMLEQMRNFTVNVSKSVIVTPNASDLDNDSLTYAFSGALEFADIGNGSWKAVPPEKGVFKMTLAVTDEESASTNQSFTVTAIIPNRAPVLEPIPNITAVVGQNIIVTPKASDADNDTLIYTFNGNLEFSDLGNGSWAAIPQQKGVFKITLTVADKDNASANQSFTVNVLLPNRAPALDPIPNITVNVGNSVLVTPRASDADNDTLNFSFASSLAFSGLNNGSWAATPQQNGTYSVTVSVSDPSGASATQGFFVFANSVPLPGNNTTLPLPGNNTTPTPSPGNNTTLPLPGNNTTIPLPGNNTTIPLPGNNTTLPPANGTDNTSTTTPAKPPIITGAGGGGGGGGAESSGAKCGAGYELVNGKCVQKQTLAATRADNNEAGIISEDTPEKPAVQVLPQTASRTPQSENENPEMVTMLLTAVKNPRALGAIAVMLVVGAVYYLFTRKYKIVFETSGGEKSEQ